MSNQNRNIIIEDDASRTRVVAMAVREACEIAYLKKTQQDWEAACQAILENELLTRTEKSTIISLLELPKGQLDNNDTKSTNELLSNDSLESFLPQQTNNNNQELPVSEPNNEPKSKSPTVNNNGNKSNCDCGKRGMDAIEDSLENFFIKYIKLN
ncbi:14864_t:CDS:2 [Entrophospora sp. SA101]|nr:14864_t:CDS:2 [Entrophospora sp. SA101]